MDSAAQVVIASADQVAPTTGAPASPNADDSSDITSPAPPITQDQEAWLPWLYSILVYSWSWPESWSSRFSILYVFSSDASTPTTSSAGSVVNGGAHTQGPLFTFVLALLAYSAGAMAAVLADSKDTVSTWRTVPKVLYGVTAVVAVASLAVGIMAAGCHAAVPVAGNSGNLRLSAFCSRLGAILSSALVVVALCCKLGRWGCATGVPSAAVIAAIMAVVWICGDERAAAQAFANCWRRIKDLCRRCPLRTSTARDLELGRQGYGRIFALPAEAT